MTTLTIDILDALERNAANDAVAQRLDDFAGLDDRADVDTLDRSAIDLGDDDVLGHVNETTGQVARVSGLERGISQTLTCAVRRDEVLEHGEAFAEVRRDGRLDDFAGRLGHQSAHTGELTNLLLRTAGAGVGHDVDRVHGSFLVRLLHVAEHLIGNLLGHSRPDLDDLVRTLAVGDRAVQILLLNFDHLLVGVSNGGVLRSRDDHVIETDGETRARRILEAQFLDAVQHADRDFKAEVLVAIADQLANALLLEQAIDEWHAFGKRVVQNGAADRGGDELLVELDRIGVHQVLIVVRSRHVEHARPCSAGESATASQPRRPGAPSELLQHWQRCALHPWRRPWTWSGSTDQAQDPASAQ